MVGNLSFDTDERGLSAALGRFGQIVDVKVVTDRDTGRSRGFGFVTFADAHQARACVDGMRGVEIDGRAVRVEVSEDRRGGDRSGQPHHGGGRGYASSAGDASSAGAAGGYGDASSNPGLGQGFGHDPAAPPPPPPPPDDGAPAYGDVGANTRGTCKDFQMGQCRRGDQCRYSHIGGPPPGTGNNPPRFPDPPRGGGTGGQVALGGDWQCEQCGNSNFSWRKACKKCNAPKSRALKDAEKQATAGWLHDGLADTSNRIFVKGFDPEKTTEDDLRELFGGIGVIARVRQRHGFPDQWPHAVKIYRDDRGAPKDEAVIKYDDPMAAQSAPGFYDGHEMNGRKLSVSIATSKARPEDEDRGGGGGGRGYGGGGRGGGYGGDRRARRRRRRRRRRVLARRRRVRRPAGGGRVLARRRRVRRPAGGGRGGEGEVPAVLSAARRTGDRHRNRAFSSRRVRETRAFAPKWGNR